jgi:RimJ/RimL family protein N-acetyltransferase
LSSTELRIPVSDGVYLSAVRPLDNADLLEHLRSKDVYNTTLNIPHPYSATDAERWIQKRLQHTQSVGLEVTFAIRNADNRLIGVVSSENFEPGLTHKAEIGYWLAKPFWGRGIMTDAVRAFNNYAFTKLHLLRLTAHTFESNLASARVLEKNGFKLEGYLRKHFHKNGQLLDARLYGLLKSDFDGLGV